MPHSVTRVLPAALFGLAVASFVPHITAQSATVAITGGTVIDGNGGSPVTDAVVVIAGGVREELQRAFVLHRFDRHLGGGAVGLLAFSILFGLGHLEQGRDVALATAALGALWGAIYLRRRSAVAPGIAHAGFNLSEIVRHTIGSV